MKRLYRTVLDNESKILPGTEPATDAGRQKATAEVIREVEQKLGVLLPKTFKQFAQQVGGATWPVSIYAAQALSPYPADCGRPAYLLAFAADAFGNDWCFDTRVLKDHEYSIVFWDHEDPPDEKELQEEGATEPFDEWLDDLVSGKREDEEGDAVNERRQRIETALEAHRETNIWPWAPSEEDISNVETAIRFSLPKDYVWFTTKLGSTLWPLEIRDALELSRLTEEMRRAFPKSKPGVVAIGRETDGSFIGFQKPGRLVAVGGERIEDRTFIDFLERRITECSEIETSDVVASVLVTDNDVPHRIVEDEHTNSVWRAVAKAKKLTIALAPDGRIQVQVEDNKGRRRRMFIDEKAWEVVQQHLKGRR